MPAHLFALIIPYCIATSTDATCSALVMVFPTEAICRTWQAKGSEVGAGIVQRIMDKQRGQFKMFPSDCQKVTAADVPLPQGD